jgi:hypothetical protein
MNWENFILWYTTVGGMRRGGSREDEPITRYKPCQRELRLQIALKPTWRMTACCVLPLFYLSLSKYNLFSQSKNCSFMVRWCGTDGKALLQPFGFCGSPVRAANVP